ncbi:S24 family peptidase [Ornithobacterium rhinotracheale]|uniref:S24 family peptidase n=1 Tax=Ornithobacterium rhinotracheale TaxID=28251 RepID=UPI001FF626C3|nr:S24 family peptidase [Ornithobacterium rhinotracheale]MCK0201114.1 S24 family peptidase [Ornithobacterium rhinotracheale]
MRGKKSNLFEKIIQISEYYGYNSINDFSINGLGYTSSEKINRLKDPNKKPSIDIINDVSNKFEINLNWLLNDIGEMVIGQKPNVQKKLYNKSITQSITKSVTNEKFKKGYTSEKEEKTKNAENTNKKNVSINVSENVRKRNVQNLLTNEEENENVAFFNEEERAYAISSLPTNRKTRDALSHIQEVPLYNFEATMGLKELFSGGKSSAAILDTIKIPNLPKCDGAIFVTGDSMYPLLKSGDIVLYKEMPLDSIFYGEMYLLSYRVDEWEEYITVKYVQKSELGGEYLKLVSQNQHHQPKDVLARDISAIALIKASIRINTMM